MDSLRPGDRVVERGSTPVTMAVEMRVRAGRAVRAGVSVAVRLRHHHGGPISLMPSVTVRVSVVSVRVCHSLRVTQNSVSFEIHSSGCPYHVCSITPPQGERVIGPPMFKSASCSPSSLSSRLVSEALGAAASARPKRKLNGALPSAAELRHGETWETAPGEEGEG